jgi:hypothetical protein
MDRGEKGFDLVLIKGPATVEEAFHQAENRLPDGIPASKGPKWGRALYIIEGTGDTRFAVADDIRKAITKNKDTKV